MKHMKYKWILSTLVVMLLFGIFTSSIFAQDEKQYVYDPTYTLTDNQLYELNNQAASISQQYECGVHFVIIDDASINEYAIQEYSENLYRRNDVFGYGNSKDGFMLVINVNTRCYWLLAYGNFANYALTDYGKDWLSERFVDNFGKNDWYGGMKDYLSGSEQVLKKALMEEPIDIYDEDNPIDGTGIIGVFFSAIAGIFTAFITTNSYKKEMQTAVKATTAYNYLDNNRANITYRTDNFTHTTETRTRIQTAAPTHTSSRTSHSSSHSRGRGTTVNSRGFSGKGGRF